MTLPARLARTGFGFGSSRNRRTTGKKDLPFYHREGRGITPPELRRRRTERGEAPRGIRGANKAATKATKAIRAANKAATRPQQEE
jgi:hypothetical protein